jgi:hypothetical protein
MLVSMAGKLALLLPPPPLLLLPVLPKSQP